MEYRQLMDFLKSKRDEVIDLQRLLCSKPAIAPDSGGSGEWEKSRTLIGWLNDHGFDNIKEYNAVDDRVPAGKRPNLVAELPGKRGGPSFWIMSHMDVVPPGDLELWKTDPFNVEVEEDRIIGRGAEDNQQGLVASIFAALYYLSQGVKPEHSVKLLFVADEEVGSKYGIQYLIENESLFAPGDVILVPDAGDSEGSEIEVAEKNVLWLKLSTHGKQTHASRPQQGVNAFLAASDLALRISNVKDLFSKIDELFQPPVSTISPTKKEANVPNVNTIPGEDVFYLDCRILPVYPLKQVLSEIDRLIKEVESEYGVSIDYEIVQRMESNPTPSDCKLVSKLSNAVRDVYGVSAKTVGIGGGTVAAHLRNAGHDTVVWARIDETAHQANEYCKIENLTGDACVMGLLMDEDWSDSKGS